MLTAELAEALAALVATNDRAESRLEALAEKRAAARQAWSGVIADLFGVAPEEPMTDAEAATALFGEEQKLPEGNDEPPADPLAALFG